MRARFSGPGLASLFRLTSARKNVRYIAQANQLAAIKEVREDVRDIHSQVLQDTLRRIDKTFKAFFFTCTRGQKAGFPQFRSKSRYDSFRYPPSGFSRRHVRELKWLLQNRPPKCRLGSFAFRCILHIPDNAHHAEPVRLFRFVVKGDTFPDGIFPGPIKPGHRLIDEQHSQRILPIPLVEKSPRTSGMPTHCRQGGCHRF